MRSDICEKTGKKHSHNSKITTKTKRKKNAEENTISYYVEKNLHHRRGRLESPTND